jgi:hypothetical protein
MLGGARDVASTSAEWVLVVGRSNHAQAGAIFLAGDAASAFNGWQNVASSHINGRQRQCCHMCKLANVAYYAYEVCSGGQVTFIK